MLAEGFVRLRVPLGKKHRCFLVRLFECVYSNYALFLHEKLHLRPSTEHMYVDRRPAHSQSCREFTHYLHRLSVLLLASQNASPTGIAQRVMGDLQGLRGRAFPVHISIIDVCVGSPPSLVGDAAGYL